MDNKLAIIGGSGIYDIEGIRVVKEHQVETPFGKPSCAVTELCYEKEGESYGLYFLPRHGHFHEISPSEINYPANILALKKLGARYVLSISAVGSLKQEFAPGDFVLPDQFIDWTKGYRKKTFFGNGLVGHVSMANPIDEGMKAILSKSCKEGGPKTHLNGTYICIEGPGFSTRAESLFYKNNIGADIIGMTNVPEAFLAKEAGMAYATCAMVTDYDAWKEEHCTLEEILSVMKLNKESAKTMIKNFIINFYQNTPELLTENQYAIITPKDKWNSENCSLAKILLEQN